MNGGIYRFKVKGQIYNYINDLVTEDGCHSCLQLYFYDTEYELENCPSDSERLDPLIISQLIDILSFLFKLWVVLQIWRIM